MATVRDELSTIWQTLIRANYDDTATLDAAINLTTMTDVSSDDLLAQLLARTLVNLRNSKTYGYTQSMTSAQKKQLYAELVTVLADMKSTLDTIYSAINTVYGALP